MLKVVENKYTYLNIYVIKKIYIYICLCVCVCYFGHNKISTNRVLYGFYWVAINLFFCLSVGTNQNLLYLKNTKKYGNSELLSCLSIFRYNKT